MRHPIKAQRALDLLERNVLRMQQRFAETSIAVCDACFCSRQCAGPCSRPFVTHFGDSGVQRNALQAPDSQLRGLVSIEHLPVGLHGDNRAMHQVLLPNSMGGLVTNKLNDVSGQGLPQFSQSTRHVATWILDSHRLPHTQHRLNDTNQVLQCQQPVRTENRAFTCGARAECVQRSELFAAQIAAVLQAKQKAAACLLAA